MGYTTDFIGHVNISPPLNDAEQQYLAAFASSRRYARTGGPYEVSPNPAAERCDDPIDIDSYNTVGLGQPSLWCDWSPCLDGCCLSHEGGEKFYGSTAWMAYLIEHFLSPGAHAQNSGLAWFDEFTFDHTLDGIIAACRQDTRELYLIRVERNRVRKEVLVRGTSEYGEFGLLA